MRIFVGMETSGALRRAFDARGHHTISCDTLPPEDDAHTEGHLHRSAHWQGDVFEALQSLAGFGWRPDAAIFHPDCTFLTNSAAWAFTDGPYHQAVKPTTLVGGARRAAREDAISTVRLIASQDIPRIIIENPPGSLSTRWRPPTQIVQPWMFGDDASKATCFWFVGKEWETLEPPGLAIDPAQRCPGRMVEWPRGSGKMVERWSNQTDSGQNRLTPGDDRWKHRARTYPGIAGALVARIEAGA